MDLWRPLCGREKAWSGDWGGKEEREGRERQGSDFVTRKNEKSAPDFFFLMLYEMHSADFR